MPVPRPLVAIERASGSVKEIWPSGSLRHLFADLFELAHLLLDRLDLLLNMLDPRFRHQRRLPVRSIQFRQIARDALLQLLHPRLELAVGEVLVAIVDRFELAAIDRDDRLGEQLQIAAQDDELPAHAADRLAVIFAKVGDRLEVRRQSSGQPNQLDVALGLALEPPARLNPVQIAVDVDL